MLYQGTIEQRNMDVLKPLAASGRIEEKNLDLINNLMLSYFHEILRQRMSSDGGLIESDKMRANFMEAVRYLVDREAKAA